MFAWAQKSPGRLNPGQKRPSLLVSTRVIYSLREAFDPDVQTESYDKDERNAPKSKGIPLAFNPFVFWLNRLQPCNLGAEFSGFDGVDASELWGDCFKMSD